MIGLQWRGGGVQKARVPPQSAVGDRHVRTRLRMQPGGQLFTVQCGRCLIRWHDLVPNNNEASRTLGVFLALSGHSSRRPRASLSRLRGGM